MSPGWEDLVAGFWSRLFKGNGKSEDGGYPDVAEAYRGFREQALRLDARAFPKAADFGGIAAVLMETGYPEAVVTLWVVVDGTVSLCYSQGKSVLGLGEHEGPHSAGTRLLTAAAAARGACAPARDFPLPRDGHTHFYLVAVDGVLAGDGEDDDLLMGRHALSSVYHAGQTVLSESRRIDEARNRGPAAR